ncbi:MAG TPA: hypothetical protein VGS17_03785 [Candidatus Limnocylindria bacterium]|nr:hypothetical protein [Candidatus Limnocylindria bacterium]
MRYFWPGTLLLALAVGCNVTAAPPPARTLPPSTRPPPALPPPPSDLPAEIPLPRTPVANTVYDLGRCVGNVPVAPPDGFLIVVYAFTMQSKPVAGAEVSGDTFTAVKTDDKGTAQVSAVVGTKSLAIRAGEKALASPVSAKAGECGVLVAYFG